ncbi:MAG: class I SAM-dependent methyltransferase [Clostridia bacterium]|nr:class I SAM-dependent methyltransferase [Clostridia bacterium]
MLQRIKSYLSTKNRKKKFGLAMTYIKPGDEIIDIGVDPCINGNVNYFEKWFQGPNKLTCLGLNKDFSSFKAAFPHVDLILFDGMDFSQITNRFDFAISNAVIEHVGDYEKQKRWLQEISKITKLLFITTPNKYSPVDAHTSTFFIHWLPDNARDFIYRKLGLEWAAKDYMWLLSQGKFRKILEEANFEILKIVKNKFLFFTIDSVIIAKSRYIEKE